MGHPVVDAHIGANDPGFEPGYGEVGTDTPMGASGVGVPDGYTPQAVAAFALAALAGIVVLRLGGFRFAVGGSIGG